MILIKDVWLVQIQEINILYISKLDDKQKCLHLVNNIDAELNTQRIYLRIMQKNRWIVDNFLIPLYVPTFINSSFACLKEKGMHRAALYVQAMIRKAKIKWKEYYVLKMDIAKYFDSIDKNILLTILKRKIKDKKLLWLLKEILFSQKREKGLEIRKLYFTNVSEIYI